MRVLLLVPLLLTGVCGETKPLFVYGVVGGEALLPCLSLLPSDCSDVSWTFFFKGQGVQFTEEVHRGRVKEDSTKAGRAAILPNCSLNLRDLRPADAGSYVCLQGGNATTDVYLSILAITSPTSITELQRGGNLSLNCMVYTYFDAGSCRSYSQIFNLSWTSRDGAELTADGRYKLQSSQNRCKTTLMVSDLQPADTNRTWRCSVSSTLNPQAKFLDFRTRFLFGDPSSERRETEAACSHSLPISRIVLCVALPVMVMVVGFFRRRAERKKTSAAAIELQDLR